MLCRIALYEEESTLRLSPEVLAHLCEDALQNCLRVGEVPWFTPVTEIARQGFILVGSKL